ncbi:MAG: ABC transporter substrate-binding protein [Candidatus Bathyarchaeia archaeon]
MSRLNNAAITKLQAIIIIVVIIIIAAVAGIVYQLFFYRPPVGVGLPPRDKVVVGIVQSLSGALSPQVTMYHPYYKWVIEDYNAKGGLYVPEYGRRFPITYIEYDDETDIHKMLTLTEKLITVDKVDLLFAPCSTGFVYAASSLYEKYRYPVIALTYASQAGAEKCRKGELKYLFQTLASPSEVGVEVRELLEYIRGKYGADAVGNVGIIYHLEQHGVEHASAIFGELALVGFNIVLYESYPFMTTEFKPLISKLIERKVDTLIICGYEAMFFVREAKAMGYNPKIMIVGPSLEVPGMTFGPLGYTLDDVRGIIFYDGWPSASYTENDVLKKWAEDHKVRARAIFGNEYAYPFPAAALFYSGLQCLFEAVQKVGLDREKIRDALVTEYFDTILGKMKFRPGYAPETTLGGTLSQWQYRYMMDTIWPPETKSAEVIYPKPSWPPS